MCATTSTGDTLEIKFIEETRTFPTSLYNTANQHSQLTLVATCLETSLTTPHCDEEGSLNKRDFAVLLGNNSAKKICINISRTNM